jgi:hypothetical protein
MTAPLELHPGRNGYVLNPDGTANELWLTHDDLLTLSHSAAQWGELVLNSQPAGVNPVAAHPNR